MTLSGVGNLQFDEEGFYGHTRAIERLALMFNDIGYSGGDGNQSGSVADNYASSSGVGQTSTPIIGGSGSGSGGASFNGNAIALQTVPITPTLPNNSLPAQFLWYSTTTTRWETFNLWPGPPSFGSLIYYNPSAAVTSGRTSIVAGPGNSNIWNILSGSNTAISYKNSASGNDQVIYSTASGFSSSDTPTTNYDILKFTTGTGWRKHTVGTAAQQVLITTSSGYTVAAAPVGAVSWNIFTGSASSIQWSAVATAANQVVYSTATGYAASTAGTTNWDILKFTTGTGWVKQAVGTAARQLMITDTAGHTVVAAPVTATAYSILTGSTSTVSWVAPGSSANQLLTTSASGYSAVTASAASGCMPFGGTGTAYVSSATPTLGIDGSLAGTLTLRTGTVGTFLQVQGLRIIKTNAVGTFDYTSVRNITSSTAAPTDAGQRGDMHFIYQ